MKNFCKSCGQPLADYSGRGRPQRFCHDACRQVVGRRRRGLRLSINKMIHGQFLDQCHQLELSPNTVGTLDRVYRQYGQLSARVVLEALVEFMGRGGS